MFSKERITLFYTSQQLSTIWLFQQYIIRYYYVLRLREYNDKLPPHKSENKYQKNSKTVTNFNWSLQFYIKWFDTGYLRLTSSEGKIAESLVWREFQAQKKPPRGSLISLKNAEGRNRTGTPVGGWFWINCVYQFRHSGTEVCSGKRRYYTCGTLWCNNYHWGGLLSG